MPFDFVQRVLVVCGAGDAGTPTGALRGECRLPVFSDVECPDEFNPIMMGWLEAHKRVP